MVAVEGRQLSQDLRTFLTTRFPMIGINPNSFAYDTVQEAVAAISPDSSFEFVDQAVGVTRGLIGMLHSQPMARQNLSAFADRTRTEALSLGLSPLSAKAITGKLTDCVKVENRIEGKLPITRIRVTRRWLGLMKQWMLAGKKEEDTNLLYTLLIDQLFEQLLIEQARKEFETLAGGLPGYFLRMVQSLTGEKRWQELQAMEKIVKEYFAASGLTYSQQIVLHRLEMAVGILRKVR